MAEDPYDAFVPTKERIGTPFTSEALTYVAQGWSPIPVKGKNLVPHGVTGHAGVVNEEKVKKQLITRPGGYDNLGVRHDGTIAVDVDVRGVKRGDETLEEFRVRHNLPHLPPTPSSTARGDDDPGRQYFFRLRTYVRLDHKPKIDGHDIEGVEICQLHHRFSVVYPSVHPDIDPAEADPTYYWYAPGLGGLTWGARLDRIPCVEELAYLPDEWVEALARDIDSELDLDADVIDEHHLISGFRDGEPSAPVRAAMERAQSQHPGHDETYRSLFNALKYGREGHPGVKNLVFLILARHRHYLESLPDQTRAAKHEELAILRDASVKAQQTPVENVYRPYSPLIPLGTGTISTGPGVSGSMPEEKPKPLTPLGSGVVKRPAQSSASTGGSEWDDALAMGMTEVDEGAVSHFVLPSWVWEQSVELATIKQAAMARMVSPDVVLHAALSIISSMVHWGSTLETGRGPSPISYYAAAVGPSGSGKTLALKCANELLKTWKKGQVALMPKDAFKQANLGTGEGMVEAYMGDDNEFIPELDEEGKPLIDDESGQPIGKWKKVRKQVRGNVLFFSDEGRQMLQLASRPGSTIMGVLCMMWSGSDTGAANAKSENSRSIEDGTYTLGLLVGFQPKTMDPLFEDAGGGAPQRFVFASAIHPDVSVDPVDFPDELSPGLPAWAPIRMELSDKHKLMVRQHHADRTNGTIEEPEIDGHRLLAQCRLAALLALLHSQTSISDEMWDLAKVIMDKSCEFRDDLAMRAQRVAAEEAQRRAEATVRTNVQSAVMVQQTSRLHEVADLIADKVGEQTNGEMPRRDAKKAIATSKRAMFDEAVTLLVTQGRVVEDEIQNPSTNRKVAVLRMTED